jgi:nicotinamide-nucleotide amidase
MTGNAETPPVWGDGELDSTVAALLRERGATLAVAESCSGGLLAKRLTDIPGSSEYFLLGVVSYANSAKTGVLHVPEELLIRHGAVSREVALAMACGVRDLAGCDVALATTGIAGPDGGSREKPVGTVYIALADRYSCQVHRYQFGGGRDEVRDMTASAALELLYFRLKNNSAECRE